jgi:hypothetical protein
MWKHFMKINLTVLFGAIALIGCAASVSAAKLFAVDVTYSGGTVSEENSSLPHLINDLISDSGRFKELEGEDVFSTSLTYFGLPDALRLSIDRTNPELIELRLTSAVTGLDTTLKGTSEEDMAREFIDWLYRDGGQDAIDLLDAIVISSAAAITDGNPNATTSVMADNTFQTFGLFQGTSRDQTMRGSESGAHVGIWLNSKSYEIDTPVGKMEGQRTQVNVPLWIDFGTRVSFVGNTMIDFNELEGTQFYGLGVDVGLAFRPILRTGDDRFGWQITPYAGTYGVGSIDGVTAAFVGQYGLINRFEWRLTERSLLSWVSQYSTFNNVTVEIDHYQLNAPIDQNILKNGLMYDFPVSPLRSLFANVFVIDTRLLKDANINSYQTLGAGLSYRLEKFSVNGRLGYETADGYESMNSHIGVAWDL